MNMKLQSALPCLHIHMTYHGSVVTGKILKYLSYKSACKKFTSYCDPTPPLGVMI